MGYLFLILALFMGLTKGFCGKKTSGTITTLRATMLFNFVRMLICIPIGFLFVLLYTHTASSLLIDQETLLISAISGIATSVFVVTWIACVRTGAYMMVDVFLTLGVIVPVILCRIFFSEAIRWNQLVGIAFLVIAAYIMCSYNNKIKKEKLTLPALLLLASSGASYGFTSFTQKWFLYNSSADISVFNFYTYIFSAIILLLCWLFVRRGSEPTSLSRPTLFRLTGYVIIMSLALFLHSLFSTMAGTHLDASTLYPVMQGGSLILSLLMSSVCFGEKITSRCISGIVVAFAALLCINLL